MSHLVKRLVGPTFERTEGGEGGDTAWRLLLTSVDDHETDKDGPFYIKHGKQGISS